MKFQLPTGHWLYFGAQIKRGKLDASGGSGDSNTATVLNQVRMAIDHPIFDPDTGRKVLVDHVFVISARDITRAAENWLVEQLDRSQRRQIIFMDRDEFLDHSARILLDLKIRLPASAPEPADPSDIPSSASMSHGLHSWPVRPGRFTHVLTFAMAPVISRSRNGFSLLLGGVQDFDVDDVAVPEEAWRNQFVTLAKEQLASAGGQLGARLPGS